jgi:thioredoxin 1
MANDEKQQEEGPTCGCGGGRCGTGPTRWVWVVFAVALVGVLIARSAGKKPTPSVAAESETPAAVVSTSGTAPTPEGASQGKPLPRLVDLGATKCIPCRMMAPILEELKKTYAGRMDVQFVDVWENPEAGKQYGIQVIPTQIFYDAAGKELFRHEGFLGREDILAKWKEFGLDLTPATPHAPAAGPGAN